MRNRFLTVGEKELQTEKEESQGELRNDGLEEISIGAHGFKHMYIMR